MSQVVVEDLVKHFRVSQRDTGVWGALRGLARRRYETVRALDGVSFEIDSGELLGYVGPNGAGKSTTVKVMSGILVPDSGRCEILGRVPWKDRSRHVGDLGVVFGQRTQLWWDLPVIESFDLLRDIYRVPRQEYVKNRDEFVAVMDIESCLDTPVRQLSLGQRMRCDLAGALLHSPKLLFLDEPTIGMDAVSKVAFRQFIKRFNQERGTTVILTTHDMDDIEAICDRLMIINSGKLLYDGGLEALRQQMGFERSLVVEMTDVGTPKVHPAAQLAALNGRRVHVRFDPKRISAAALLSDFTAHNDVEDLFVENPPIEELIARFYEGNGVG